MDFNNFSSDGYNDQQMPSEGLIPWLIKKISNGDANFYNRNEAERQNILRQQVQNAPAAAPVEAVAGPATQGRVAAPAPALAAPTQAVAAPLQATPAPDASYQGPDAPFNLSATPMAQAMGSQQGILDRLANNPQAAALLSQLGAGLLSGKTPKQGIANAASAVAEYNSKSNAVKRTPIANGTAILEEYADGTSKVVPVDPTIPNRANKPGKDYIWDKTKNDWILDPNSKTARDMVKTDAANKLQNRAALDEADNALRTIDQLEQQMKGGKVLGVDTTTGLLGAAAGMVPGTSAYDVRETVKTIQGAFGIGKLQEMKRATPTGASGFGQLAVKELELLMALVTNLNPNQKPETVNANIAKAKEHFTRYRGYVEQAIAAGDGLPNQPASNAPAAAPTGGSVQDRASGYLR